MNASRNILLLATLLSGLYCGGDTKTEENALVDSGTNNPVDAGLTAATIEIVSGQNQSASVGTTLADSIVVLVKDQDGGALQGATVMFSTDEGSVPAAQAMTDASGQATTAWTLGSSEGRQTLTVTALGIEGSPLSVIAEGQPLVPPAIGDFYQGGVVFYLDDSGDHGLVITVVNQSEEAGAPWGCAIDIPDAENNEIGTGASNTAAIELACDEVGTAADLCANLDLNGYDDWFLPSMSELAEVFQSGSSQLWQTVDATALQNGGEKLGWVNFWTSSQFGASKAGRINYVPSQGYDFKSKDFHVRAVRAF